MRRDQKVFLAILGTFIAICGAGFITFQAGTEYLGEPNQVCMRDGDGNRTCSDPARTGAELAVFFGAPSSSAIVTSEPMLVASRVLFASLVPFVGGVLLAINANQNKRKAAGESNLLAAPNADLD